MATIMQFVFVFQALVTTSTYAYDDNFFPAYQLSLNYRRIGHYCGGAIIKKNAALTVAYCLTEKEIGEIFFRCGITDLAHDSNLGAFGKAAFIHEEFDGTKNIVALALVEKNFPIDGVKVTSISISERPVTAGSNVTIIGWDTYGFAKEEQIKIITETEVTVVGYGKCAAIYGEFQPDIPAPGTMCADSKGYCFGNSGSPLVDKFGHLVGAVPRHEAKCFKSDLPGLYCDFFYYKSWIDDKLKRSGLRSNASRALSFISVLFTFTWATRLLS